MRVVPTLATCALVLGLVFGAAACGAGGGGGPSDLGAVPTTIVIPSSTSAASASEPATPATVLPAYASLVARSEVDKLEVYAQPDAAKAERAFTGPAPVFLVESQRDDGWVNVLLPVLPEGTTGWVRDADVTITQVAYRLRVELGAGRLRVFNRGKETDDVQIAIATAARATKPGHYFLRTAQAAPISRMTASPFVYALIPRLAAGIPLGTPVDVAS
jgi:hypothetical protein